MSAPSIPNLSTFRTRTRTGLRGRGRGRGRPDPTSSDSDPAPASQPQGDAAIQQTDHDAVSARWSAVNLGYLEDAYIDTLVPQASTVRRYPLINRGTYVRTRAIDTLIERFLAVALNDLPQDGPARASPRAQILSLGAGSDTRPFRLLDRFRARGLVYHETDFEANTRAKIAAVRSSEMLRRAAGLDQPDAELDMGETTLSSRGYHIHPLDLRDLAAAAPTWLHRDIPTLVLSECCLCYLDATTSSSSLQSTLKSLDPSTPTALIVYEPIKPHDAFGQTMVSNLASRGILMPSLSTYPDLDAQRQRMLDLGFDEGQAVDVERIYYSDLDLQVDEARWIDEAERARVEALEWLDEVEEWRLLGSHYCVAWGWRRGGSDVFGPAWGDITTRDET